MTPELLDLVYDNDHLAELDIAERRLALRDLISESMPEDLLTETVRKLSDAVDGFGPLTDLMQREDVSDVMVNGPNDVWVDSGYGPQPADISFRDEAEVRELADRLLGRAGRRVDASHPISDARLPDGSRISVVIPPIASPYACISIRRFPNQTLSIHDLVRARTVTDDQMRRLENAVKDRRTIVISGGTGCGKTTLLNALLALVPSSERVVTIEETPELRPRCAHHVSLVTREVNSEGRGSVAQARLVRAALRMRPDRIVVGEVRGAEALAALAAMSVGHEGSMVTIHARSAEGVIPRFVSLALEANSGASERTIREQAIECFDLFVHLQRTGPRRQVVEIVDTSRKRM
jgi:pilus assembly protein CpaF